MTVKSENIKATNPKDAVGSKKAVMTLLSPIAKLAWMAAAFCGAKKYGIYNWRGAPVRMSVYLDAMERHQMALLSGEWYDPEDGTLHLGNIMACCAILLDAHASGTLIDDRPIETVDYRAALAEAEGIMAKLTEKYKEVKPRHFTKSEVEAFEKAIQQVQAAEARRASRKGSAKNA